MAATSKPRAASTLQVKCWAGTPQTRETVTKTSASTAKEWLGDRVKGREKWAERYNGATKRQLELVREGLDSVNIPSLKVGAVREWTAVDDYTGVTFVFGLEVLSK